MEEVWGIVVAAGQSRRMHGLGSKIWMDLGGRSVLERSLTAFAIRGGVRRGVVVGAPEDLERIRAMLTRLELDAWDAVAGGRERHESVQCGLRWGETRRDGEDAVVLIHDAVRCLVPPAVIARVAKAARITGAAVPVIPVTDTVKLRGADGVVRSTVPRDSIALAQTPQGFRLEVIRQAYRRWRQGIPTDDAEVVEAMGHPVQMVEGDRVNQKLTTPADLEWFLWQVERGG